MTVVGEEFRGYVVFYFHANEDQAAQPGSRVRASWLAG